jgi:hypothetical protein
MSRQFDRQLDRIHAKRRASTEKRQLRTIAGRALEARQLERERNGFYSSRGTVANMTGSRSTPIKDRKISKRKPFGRTLHSQVIDGVEISYHATKGWRRHAA